jgi:hypothetical protein
MRVRSCLAVMRCLDELSCFLAAEFSFCSCDVRTVEDTMVYWTLCGFVCKLGGSLAGNECWVVVDESACALGDRRVCVKVTHV